MGLNRSNILLRSFDHSRKLYPTFPDATNKYYVTLIIVDRDKKCFGTTNKKRVNCRRFKKRGGKSGVLAAVSSRKAQKIYL